MAAEIVRLPTRFQLAKERAQRLLNGEEMGRFAHGRGGFDLDLSTFRCGLCRGEFPPIGWVIWMTEDEHSVYIHEGCGKEAENWSYDPSQDDYPEYNCEVCGAMVDHKGQWCPKCQKGA